MRKRPRFDVKLDDEVSYLLGRADQLGVDELNQRLNAACDARTRPARSDGSQPGDLSVASQRPEQLSFLAEVPPANTRPLEPGQSVFAGGFSGTSGGSRGQLPRENPPVSHQLVPADQPRRRLHRCPTCDRGWRACRCPRRLKLDLG